MIKFLKLNKKGLPPLKSLQPQVFNVSKFWFVALGSSILVLAITNLFGFWLFYSQYVQSYKNESESASNFKNLINIDKLKDAIEKRVNLINTEIVIPKDPSL